MKRYAFAAVVALFAAAAVVGVAAADAGPLVNAGLDQEVGVNTTVQLDGTGSSHPDGTIDGYEWSIETPAGARTTPTCADCGRISFRPSSVGLKLVRPQSTHAGVVRAPAGVSIDHS